MTYFVTNFPRFFLSLFWSQVHSSRSGTPEKRTRTVPRTNDSPQSGNAMKRVRCWIKLISKRNILHFGCRKFSDEFHVGLKKVLRCLILWVFSVNLSLFLYLSYFSFKKKFKSKKRIQLAQVIDWLIDWLIRLFRLSIFFYRFCFICDFFFDFAYIFC